MGVGMTYGLTRPQLDVLRYITGYIAAKGYGPSMREIARDCGFSHVSCAAQRLAGLEERGFIRRLANRARAIEVLHAPAIPRAPDGQPLFVVLANQS